MIGFNLSHDSPLGIDTACLDCHIISCVNTLSTGANTFEAFATNGSFEVQPRSLVM